MLFKNLFGCKPQTQKEESVNMEEKAVENKEVKIEQFLGVNEAKQIINDAFKLYDEHKTELPGYEE